MLKYGIDFDEYFADALAGLEEMQADGLLERLDKGRQRPLTLISAPAGYGKSVLASAWLETRDGPSAWVSLDERDNDPVGFLTYVIVAVQRVFPGADLETRSMLRAPSIPPPLVLARSLANDLDRLESFILVLDDYHRISDMAVHELLNELLQHPPRSLHLLITSRGDPPLDLDRMRANDWWYANNPSNTVGVAAGCHGLGALVLRHQRPQDVEAILRALRSALRAAEAA